MATSTYPQQSSTNNTRALRGTKLASDKLSSPHVNAPLTQSPKCFCYGERVTVASEHTPPDLDQHSTASEAEVDNLPFSQAAALGARLRTIAMFEIQVTPQDSAHILNLGPSKSHRTMQG
jgi:hypothetical protein